MLIRYNIQYFHHLHINQTFRNILKSFGKIVMTLLLPINLYFSIGLNKFIYVPFRLISLKTFDLFETLTKTITFSFS